MIPQWRRRLFSGVALASLLAACGSTVATGPGASIGPSAAASRSPLPVAATGVRGTITAGPTCPVERIDSPCPPRPVIATVTATNAQGAVVGTITSDAQGRFALALPEGTYTLSAAPGSTFPRCSPTQVTVPPGRVASAGILCDTGIR